MSRHRRRGRRGLREQVGRYWPRHGQPPVTHTVVVPARMRIAVNPSSLMPGASTTYATEVEAAGGGQIVVERAMYWPGWPNWLGSHVSLGRPQ